MYGQCDPYVQLTCGGVTHQSAVKRNSVSITEHESFFSWGSRWLRGTVVALKELELSYQNGESLLSTVYCSNLI